MNQIICKNSITLEMPKNSHKNIVFLKFTFYSLVFLSVFLTAYYIYFRYDINQLEKFSKEFIKDFNITTLYTTYQDDYSSVRTNNEILETSNLPSNSVIGIVEIPKLNLVYPILSDINKDFLKLSPCKFYGPNPNRPGNLCIAAHNYKNGTFFSDISKLTNGDIITIIDNSGLEINYVIFNVYTTSSKDTSCMSQTTNNKRVITLITCDSFDNNYRTVVVAKEI